MKESLGFGIVGCGLIADFHARALCDVAGGHLVGVWGRNPERAAEFGRRHGCRAFGSEEEMLGAAEVDVVLIATPSGVHAESAIAAAEAGKHVLCEKPLDVTTARIDAMIAAHAQAGTKLGCIFQLRYMPVLEPIRAALAAGRLGRVTHAGVYVPWWRTQEYYSESSWHGTVALDGGGALMNQAIHMVDLLCDLMPPVRGVQGVVSSIGHSGIEVEDAAVVALEFEGGAVGVIHGTTSAWPGGEKRLEIYGTAGSIVMVEDCLVTYAFSEECCEDEEVRERFGSRGEVHGASDPAALATELHTRALQEFSDSLRGGVEFSVGGVEARRSVAVVEAAYRSAREGRRVEVG